MKKVSFFKQIIALLLILKSASALWAAPPNMVLDISPSSANSFPQHWAIFNNKLYFNADNGTNGRELWVYDGTNTPRYLITNDIEVRDENDIYSSLDNMLGISVGVGLRF